jgi:aspartyl-tRNA(Asn)/glutamyl-tRNA(Gln) amidotransferase subunit C
MIVDRNEARRIARLARLEMDDATLDRMAQEMSGILDYIDQIRDVESSVTAPQQAGPVALREDKTREAGVSSQVAANAPHWRDGFFVVPKVIPGSDAGE